MSCGHQGRFTLSPLSALAIIGFVLIVLTQWPQEGLAQTVQQRHVIVAFDVSGSMQESRMDRARKYLTELLYVGPPDRLDSADKWMEKPTLEGCWPSIGGLYGQGDLLTFYTFHEKIKDYPFQARQAVDREQFRRALPTRFSGRHTFLIGAELEAFENYRKFPDLETYYVLVSDLKADPPESSPELQDRRDQHDKMQKKIEMDACVRLLVGKDLWLKVWKVKEKVPPPPPDVLSISPGEDGKLRLVRQGDQLAVENLEIVPKVPNLESLGVSGISVELKIAAGEGTGHGDVSVGSKTWRLEKVPTSRLKLKTEVFNPQESAKLTQAEYQGTVTLTYAVRGKTMNPVTSRIAVLVPPLECPSDPFWIQQGQEAGRIRLVRDDKKLVLDNLAVVPRNIEELSRANVRIDKVELTLLARTDTGEKDVGVSTHTWHPGTLPSGPLTLEPKIYGIEDSRRLTPADYVARFKIFYSCRGNPRNPVLKQLAVWVEREKCPENAFVIIKSFDSRERLTELSLKRDGKLRVPALILARSPGVDMSQTIAAADISLKFGGVSKTWKNVSMTSLPKVLEAFDLPGDDSALKEGSYPAEVVVTYTCGGAPITGAQSITFHVPPPPPAPGKILILIVVGLVALGVAAYIIIIIGGTRRFSLILREQTGGGEKFTSPYELRKGKSLHLSSRGEPNCRELDLPGWRIDNRKGELYLVREGSQGTPMSEGVKYSVVTAAGEPADLSYKDQSERSKKQKGDVSEPPSGRKRPDW